MDAWTAMEEDAGKAVMKTPATKMLVRRNIDEGIVIGEKLKELNASGKNLNVDCS